MIEIKDLGFGVIEIFDKDTQYAPAQSIKIGNNTYIREDLINKQIADLQHRLEVSDRATKLACKELDDSDCIAICNYCPYNPHNIQETCPNECPQNTILLEKYFKEQAEKELKGATTNE